MFPISDRDVIRTRRPVVNITIIVLCLAVFVYELAIGSAGRWLFILRYGIIPAELTTGVNFTGLPSGGATYDITTPVSNWLTLITSVFLHGSWLHIASNMLFLWVFGDNIEDRFGHFKYHLFYLASGIAGSILQIAFMPGSETPVIGASGAISGVLGAYIILFPTNRIYTAVIVFFIFFIRIPAIILLGGWFLLQFFGGVGSLVPSLEGGGIAYWAHIGGFGLGVLAGIIYRLFKHGGGPRAQSSGDTKYWRGRPIEY